MRCRTQPDTLLRNALGDPGSPRTQSSALNAPGQVEALLPLVAGRQRCWNRVGTYPRDGRPVHCPHSSDARFPVPFGELGVVREARCVRDELKSPQFSRNALPATIPVG
jgi:hypothetical protein